MAYTDEELYSMSDEELAAAFKDAKNDYTDEINDSVEPQDEINDSADYVEQPVDDEDSDDDASANDEVEAEANEETEVNDDGEPDEGTDDQADDTTEVEDKTAKDVQPVTNQPYTFKANGKDYTFSEDEVKAQFPKIFGQAMDYTKKMQAMKPWRKTIDAMEQAKLNHDDVNLMIDVLKGDKDAIAEVIKRTGVDALELDTEDSKYVAKDYGRDDATLALRDVIDEISGDPEYETTHKILANEWDDTSWKRLSSDPEMIKLLHIDVKNGMFQRLQPIADKLKTYDRGSKSDLEYYGEAARQYAYETQQAQRATEERNINEARAKELDAVRANQQKVVNTKEAAQARKAATPVKKTAGVKKVVDYLDDSDEEYDKWYKEKIQNG
jgi:hypothetical protein